MNFKSLLPFLTAAILLSATFIHKSEPTQNPVHSNTVNAVLGDTSYMQSYGVEPDASTPEQLRLQTHLNYVIALLEQKQPVHLSESQQQNRAHIIDLLQRYTDAGVFPKNHHFKTRRPIFMDRDGNLCAVGYLIAQTEGHEAAEHINRHHKFDYIKDINPTLIDGWLAENGLTQTEAAMIQPTYGGGNGDTHKETIKNNHIETEYAVGSSLLAGAQIGISAYTLFADDVSKRSIYALNGAMGLASLTLGVINVDNSRTETYTRCGIVPPCWEQKTIYKNPSRTNLSIANIVVGGASVLYNGFRFFHAKKQDEISPLSINPAPVYDPNTGTTAPGLSLSMSF